MIMTVVVVVGDGVWWWWLVVVVSGLTFCDCRFGTIG